MQIKRIIISILFIVFYTQIIEAQNLSSAKYISLIKGKSYLLTLKPEIKIKRYALSNQEIADVQEITCHELLLIGRKIGTTRLIVWPEEGNTQVYDISVNLDMR